MKVILKEGCIVTELFIKPTDTHQYLHQTSCHPCCQKSTISYSQVSRLCSICLQETDYVAQTKQLKWYLVNQTHDRLEVKSCIDHVTNIKNVWVRVTLKPQQQIYKVTCQCTRPSYKTCMHLKLGVKFSSAMTGENFQAGQPPTVGPVVLHI